MRKFTVAVVQMDTKDDGDQNLKVAVSFIERRSNPKNAKLISYPEQMNYIGRGIKGNSEEVTGKTFKVILQQA